MEWISVEERLPPGGLVLAYRPDNPNEPIATIFYDWWMERRGGKYEVTHWMPLPAPPQN